MRFGVALSRMHPSMFVEAAEAADELGFDSLWLAEHLVLPVEMSSSPFPGQDHPPVPPSLPVFDVFAYLAHLAGRTRRIRLATHVYNLGLRHPFVAARAVQTADIVSGGRLEVGVGAGWLPSEWAAAGLDFHTRGARLDEALEVCRRLWTEETVAHDGRFFSFPTVMFEPKPVQRPHPPVIVGGESSAALARAARWDGWVGMHHTPETARLAVDELRRRRVEAGRGEEPFTVTVGADVETDGAVEALERAGVDRVIVSPWARTRDVPAGLAAFAARHLA